MDFSVLQRRVLLASDLSCQGRFSCPSAYKQLRLFVLLYRVNYEFPFFDTSRLRSLFEILLPDGLFSTCCEETACDPVKPLCLIRMASPSAF